jgi:hypothetical protein
MTKFADLTHANFERHLRWTATKLRLQVCINVPARDQRNQPARHLGSVTGLTEELAARAFPERRLGRGPICCNIRQCHGHGHQG